ncbi:MULTISPECIES: hypothetical protein [unclassified Streptomyces]|uniref:hypothetical protein n=1 Tax=unclassified Streptomyces TaxID=2593676 RepID=UPI0033F9303B
MNIPATVSTPTTGPSAVIAAPESDLAPLLAAWDHAHSAATGDPEWRHLLDEMAHPRTTQAFNRLAVGR